MRSQINIKYLLLFLLFISICVVLIILFARGGAEAIFDAIHPEPTLVKLSISEIGPQNDGQRITVEGIFHDREEYLVVGYDFDCKNFWLEEQPSGEDIDLCISAEHNFSTSYDYIDTLQGQKVLVSGTVVTEGGENYQWQIIRIDAEDSIQVLP